ncbi:Iron(II)-dependent oxidoreductase EgtB [Maioricimonas rarisocia]|uniref:Iron(II)-dependent oxidoreductase EgtB n=1 Tax=Maioricimonas rarisocia TaxID=2528026 RepID=A0A517ZCV6_9PLAN|nr:ergothioneine biosynthesis protein EgtB [Maioricimonas rarisocia]QDU40318.1 Iron(II)-dependent oxidoreductase EgtB [Maioricimonas rarisocia]
MQLTEHASSLDELRERFQTVRNFSETLCEPLTPEDCVVQSMPDVSPTRWHLAHTSWFFETFVLARQPDYTPHHPEYEYLFNSYYNSVGKQFPRPQRGMLTRPGRDEVIEYRHSIDVAVSRLLEDLPEDMAGSVPAIIELGLHHEQQHQELILTDIKHVLSCNPLMPVYREGVTQLTPSRELEWIDFDGGIREIGHTGSGFAYDNESPRHEVLLRDFSLASRPVTAGDYLAFIEDDGYRRPELWLSMGWSALEQEQWTAPLYWFEKDGKWWEFTLAGPRPLNPAAPVCHVSYFEADAFARWANGRLPTETEWEVACATHGAADGHFVDGLLAADRPVHPAAAASDQPIAQMLGDVWEWTASPYVAYPGYRAAAGALGEYNGKFMCNQYVLRGGSCATHSTHIRPTYRNFFPPEARWQFSGFRLARDAE